MSWLRLDDGFADHPKIAELTELQAWRWLRVLLYCARHETDGKVTRTLLRTLGITERIEDRYLELGLLDRQITSEMEEGFILIVRDFLEYNPSRVQRESTRARWRESKRTSRTGQNVHAGVRGGVHAGQDVESTVESPVPFPLKKEPSLQTSTKDVARAKEGDLELDREFITARLLSSLRGLGESQAEYVRTAAERLPESTLAGLVELVGRGHARDPIGYVLGALRRELSTLDENGRPGV